MQQPDSSTLWALGVLELVAKSDSPPTLDDLTHTSGLPKPTVYRILGLLMRGGLVVREPFEKRYAAGPRLHSLALDVHLMLVIILVAAEIFTNALEHLG